MSVDISMSEPQPVVDAMEEDFQVFTVAPAGESADFCTIQSAISAVMALEQGYCRMRISVRGGVYEEGQLDIPAGLQIVAADGCEPDSASPVIIAARADHPAISSRAKGALIRGIRIEHNGPFGSMACVVIEAGDIRMENCVVTGSVSIGVLVHGDATPTLVGCEVLVCCGDGIKVSETGAPTILQCMIHDNDGFGIFCTGTSAGLFKENDIHGNSNAGVAARGSAHGLFKDNKVHDGKQGGFWLEEEARCELVGNDIFQNQKSGIQVGGHANPNVVRNIVRDGMKGGIVVHDQATGTFAHNEIMRNTMAGVGGTDFACPLFHSNNIVDGKGGGIVLHESCGGVFEKNQVVGNTHAGIGLKGSSNALFDSNYISDGTGYGIWVQERAMSTLQNNVIERNMRAGVVVTDTANPTLAVNIIRDGKHAGLLVRHKARGQYRQNTLSHNAHGNIVLLEEASSELIGNVISHGPLGGIIIRGNTTVTVRGNTICHNDGANIAVLDNSNPICDGNVLTNGAGRGLVIMDKATGVYRFNMIRNSELAGVYVGRQARPELVANCICDGKAAGILLEDEAGGHFTHNIVCANQNEGVAVHGRAQPVMECNVVLQGVGGGIWLDENAGGTFRGNVVEDSGGASYRSASAHELRLAERNTNTAPAALAESLAEWAEEKMQAPGGNKKVILVHNPDACPERGVAMATQCSELLGLDPSRSCMLVARFLGDAGQFEDAEELINRTRGFLGESGAAMMGPAVRGQQFGDMALHCAELLNKWAAASPAYSNDLVTRAAGYSLEAARIFSSLLPSDSVTLDSFASALYWVGLNFATLGRLGGCGEWTAQQACDIADDAIDVALGMVTDQTPPHRVAELYFVHGVLSFCKAAALEAKHISLPPPSPAPVPASPEEAEAAAAAAAARAGKELLEHASGTMALAYKHWCEAYGEKHLQTVKAITMIGLLERKLGREEAGIEWYRKELRIREELQGELHPRTQQARRTYTSIIDEQLSRTRMEPRALSMAMAAAREQSAGSEPSPTVVARYLGEAGQFQDAEVLLTESNSVAGPGPATAPAPDVALAAEARRGSGASEAAAACRSREDTARRGDVALHCAELLNKWAAASPEYSKDLVMRAAEYSVDAAESLRLLYDAAPGDEGVKFKYSSALYWMGLNFATLCRLGGAPDGKWTTQQAYDLAHTSLAECEALRAGATEEVKAEVIFAQGVLSFCKAEAVNSGFLRSTKMEKALLVDRKFKQALRLFEQANALWASAYGDKHLETVKAITMIGILQHRLAGAQASLEWCRKELRIREELQGEMHPRTQQARRTYTMLLDEKLQAERRDGSHPGSNPGNPAGASAAATAAAAGAEGASGGSDAAPDTADA